jgi:hypothetical protein
LRNPASRRRDSPVERTCRCEEGRTMVFGTRHPCRTGARLSARILAGVTRSALMVLVAELPFRLKPIAEIVARHCSPSQRDFVGAGRNLMVTHAVRYGLGRVRSRRPETFAGVSLHHSSPPGLEWLS